MNYRRAFVPGGTFFFTLVTYQRRKIFTSSGIVELLRDLFRDTQNRYPLTIISSVILPDHMHFIWSLPQNTSDYSTRWRLIKSHFTRNYSKLVGWVEGGSSGPHPVNPTPETQHSPHNLSRLQKGEREIWQRRFWEHVIRDEKDLTRHVEYIHYNPVKHGFVKSPIDWPYSSFKKYVQEGFYSSDWGSDINFWEGERWME